MRPAPGDLRARPRGGGAARRGLDQGCLGSYVAPARTPRCTCASCSEPLTGHRARPLADPPRPTPLPGAGPAGTGRSVRAARGRGLQRCRCCSAARSRAARPRPPRSSTPRHAAADPRLVYHGRVVRRNGWIVLQYLYFYFMNDFRSTFNGANDHEADWEQVLVYLEDRPDGPRPVWIAAAAHDYVGDQLRRRWDDPTLVKAGRPPGALRRGGFARQLLRAGRVPHQRPAGGPQGAHQLHGRGARLLGRTRSGSPTRATWRRILRMPCRRRSWTMHAATAWPSGRARRPSGRLSNLRRRCVGGRLPRPLRPGHARPLRWRALSGRPQVQPQRHAAHDLARPAGLRRPGQGSAPVPVARSAARAPGFAGGGAERDRGHHRRNGSSALKGLSLEVQALALDGGMQQLYVAGSTELAAGELELRGLRKRARRARRPSDRHSPRAGPGGGRRAG